MQSESIVRVKVGADIEWHASWLQESIPVDLTDYEINCQIRDTSGTLAVEMTITKENQTTRRGAFVLKATAAQTVTVRPTVYDCDIIYTDSTGRVEATETFLVEFIKRISRVE